MSFSRKPKLNKEVEEALKADLTGKEYGINEKTGKRELVRESTGLWEQGYPAETIAEMLEFGKYPYESLHPFHVWLYRSKFNKEDPGCLPPRRKRGKNPRYLVPPDKIIIPSIDEIKIILDKKYPIMKNIAGDIDLENLSFRAYAWTHFYSPLRVSEIVSRRLDQFTIDEKNKILTIAYPIDDPRLKKVIVKKDADFFISLDFPYVKEELLKYLKLRITRTQDSSKKAFPFTRHKGWKIIKSIVEDGYPHKFRHEYISNQANDPSVPLSDILADTDLNLATVRTYIETGERQRLASLQRRKERLGIK